MAATNFTPISLYYTTTAAAAPVAGNLVNGELAINITDGKLYYKNNAGVVTLLASTSGASGDVVGPASATDNALARFDLTTGKLIQNSVGILSDAGVLTGLTGLTSSGSITFSSLTSGRVPYATTAGLLTDSANLLYSGTDLTVYGLTVGRGAGSISTNTALGASALVANTSGPGNTASGYRSLYSTTTGGYNSGHGFETLFSNIGGAFNSAFGAEALRTNDSGDGNSAFGRQALYSGTAGSNNTGIGYSASYSNATGNNNTAVGYSSLYNNTASNNTALGKYAGFSNSTGNANVFIGSESSASGLAAGYSNTTGSFNTAVGSNALALNSTAPNNTAVGYQALYASTAGYNTAVGYQAGAANTTGFVTAIGTSALRNNTTGASNTAVGNTTLLANTTGNYNIGIGDYALQANTTASNNTAVGYQALYANTTGRANAALGSSAGVAITTGNGNTMIGQAAGASLTTGSKNTFVGGGDQATNFPAGYYVTTGSSNVILGGYSGQGAPISATGSNNIVLSDGDGNIRGIFDSSGNLLVGCTTTPSASVGGVQMCNPAGTACKMSAGSATSFVSYLEFINGNGLIGSITGSGTLTSYNVTSDYRLKENIAPMTGALAKVAQLKPVTYKWKVNGSDGQGFIAHELQAVVPDCVTGEKDAVDADGKPIYQGMDTSHLVATLVSAIQEQQVLIESLTARLTALESK